MIECDRADVDACVHLARARDHICGSTSYAFMRLSSRASRFKNVFDSEFVCMCGLARFVLERPLCILFLIYYSSVESLSTSESDPSWWRWSAHIIDAHHFAPHSQQAC